MSTRPFKYFIPIFLSVFYFGLYYFFYSNTQLEYVGMLTLLGQAGLDLSALIIALKVCAQNARESKNIFMLFSLSFGCAFISDCAYNFFVNILHFKSMSNLLDSIFDIPFLGFLTFQLIAWAKIFPKISNLKNSRSIIILCLPVLLIAILVALIFIFTFRWKIDYLSLQGFYQITDTLIEISCFLVVILCLAIGKSFEIKLISVGFLIIIASDFIIRTSVVEGKFTNNSILEVAWTLGISFMVYGLYNFNLQKKTIVSQWTYGIKNLQFQCALWAFIACLAPLLTFQLICYFFNSGESYIFTKEFKSLPSTLILFLIPVALISNLFCKKLLSPIKSIEMRITDFMKRDFSAANFNSDIIEFNQFNIIIENALTALKEKQSLDQALLKISLQVAHDIRSPLMVLKTILNDLSALPERKRIDARNAIQRVTDIANNLLVQYRQEPEKSLQNLSSEPIAIMLESIISEKRLQIENNSIDIKLDFSPEMYSAFVNVDIAGFKRVLSNLRKVSHSFDE